MNHLFTRHVALLLLIGSGACQPETPDPIKPTGEINQLIRASGKLPELAQTEQAVEVARRTGLIFETAGYVYAYQERTLRLARAYTTIPNLAIVDNASAASLVFPGMIIKTSDLRQQGVLTSVGNLPREPIRLSFTPLTLPSVQISPVQATIEDARLTALKSFTGLIPANLNVSMQAAYSQQESLLKQGFGVSWAGLSANRNVAVTTKVERQTITLDIKQVYYTLATDYPGEPAGFFGAGLTTANLSALTTPANPLGYVEAVQYGRRILLTMSYEATEDQTTDEVTAKLKLGPAFTQATADTYTKNLLNNANTDIRLAVLGGDSQQATSLFGNLSGVSLVDKVFTYMRQGGTDVKAAVPIAYTVRYVSDNSTLTIGGTTDYVVNDSFRLAPREVAIKQIRLTVLPIRRDNGADWDEPGTGEKPGADVYVRLLDGAGNQLLRSSYRQNVTQEDVQTGSVAWSFNLPATIGQLDRVFRLEVLDDDQDYTIRPAQDDKLGEISFALTTELGKLLTDKAVPLAPTPIWVKISSAKLSAELLIDIKR